MKHKILPALVGAILLSSCAISYDNTVRKAELSGSFEEELRKGYVELADSEAAQGDFIDTSHYKKKARMIVNNGHPDPEDLRKRKIPVKNLNELADARNALVTAFAKNSKSVAPKASAKAQYMFDCWVEQQEENFQWDHIAHCREGYKRAYANIASALNLKGKPPEPMAKPVDTTPKTDAVMIVKMPDPFLVFFGFDKPNLADGAEKVLARIVDEVPVFKPGKIVVSGHADRAGTEAYNIVLSRKRAETVAEFFKKHGVSADIFEIHAEGESSPRVPTQDGVREPENRFVRIKFVE